MLGRVTGTNLGPTGLTVVGKLNDEGRRLFDEWRDRDNELMDEGYQQLLGLTERGSKTVKEPYPPTSGKEPK